MLPRRALTPWPLLVATMAACSAPPATSVAPSDFSVATEHGDLAIAPDLSHASPGDMTGECADEVGDRALGGKCVHAVTGQVVDENGVPLSAVTVTTCAAACYYGTTDAAGVFTVQIDQYLRVELYSLLLHVNPRRAAYYLALPDPDAGGIVRFPAPLPALPMPASGPVILADKSAQTVKSSGVTLDIDAGTTIFFSIEDTGDMPLGGQLRPFVFTKLDKLPFAAGLSASVLYGFGPFEIDIRKPARLSFDNIAALPANSAVDVLGQRGLIRGGPPGARFDVVATAHVSSDGKTIAFDPGAGVDTLTWIALRKH